MPRQFIPRTIYNQKAVNFLYRLEDIIGPLDSECYIQLDGNSDDSHNVVNHLKYKSYRRIVIALLKAAEFYDTDFTFGHIPHIQRIALYYYELNGNNLPEVVELETSIRSNEFTALQKAELDLTTFKLHYTTYLVHITGCFNPMTGIGKLPVNSEGEFDFSRHHFV